MKVLSTVISFLTTATTSLGTHLSSSTMTLILRPWMPPFLLVSSYHILAACSASRPNAASGPDIGANSPMVISLSVMPGSAARAALAVSTPASAAANSDLANDGHERSPARFDFSDGKPTRSIVRASRHPFARPIAALWSQARLRSAGVVTRVPLCITARFAWCRKSASAAAAAEEDWTPDGRTISLRREVLGPSRRGGGRSCTGSTASTWPR